ncbi:MAG: transporter [Francisellaceae bacterium]|nr:transporter [Francisellaceae bacterium]
MGKGLQKQQIYGKAIWMCLLGALFYCYEFYLRVTPSVMSDDIRLAFGISEAAFGHLSACYYYAYTPLQIPAGLLMDKIGPRRILTLACLCCALGTALFSVSKYYYIAQLGRFLIGTGSAFAYVGVLKISNIWLPEKYFALMAGFCTALGMLGGMLGLTTMAFFVNKIGWQHTLYLSSATGCVLMILLFFGLKDRNPYFDNNETLIKKGKLNPLIPEIVDPKYLSKLKDMFKSRAMWLNGFIGCITYLPISVFVELWAIPYFQSIGIDKAVAANICSIGLLGFALGGPFWGMISDKIKSRKRPLMIGPLLSALFMVVLIFMPGHSMIVITIMLFACTFFASSEVLVFAISNDLSANNVSATAASFTNMLVMLGGALLQPLVGQILDYLNTQGKNYSLLPMAEDYSYALVILPILLIIASFLSFTLKETYEEFPTVNE